MRLTYGIVVAVATLMLRSVAWGLACKLPGNVEASCVPLNDCKTWQGFLSKKFIPKRELTAFNSVVRACHSVEKNVCCAKENIIKKKAEVAPECLQDRLGDSYRHNGTYPNSSSFIAFIQCQNETTPSSTCGGSLITSQYVLTAAHCVISYEECYVYVGATNVNYTHDDGYSYPDGTVYEVEQANITIHEDYNRTTKVHDIALIRLNEPVDFSLPTSPKPVCIPSAKHFEAYLSDYQTLRTFGWGQNIHGNTTNIKQVVHLEYVSLDRCREQMDAKSKQHGFVIDEYTICTHTVSGHNAFKGFSGSPLLYRQNEVWFMVGLNSHGLSVDKRSSNYYPFIFTSFVRDGDWIIEKINRYETIGWW